MRGFAFVLAFITAAAGQAQPPGAPLTSLLDGDSLVSLKIEAPLQQLFSRGAEDETVTVPATVSAGTTVWRDVALSVRGHTSRRETECTFPKLKLKLKGAGSIKIGTHCGESADDHLTQKYGRLANERSPLREAVAYRMLHAAGVPALRARPARITYVDTGTNGTPLARNALVLEDDDDAMERAGGRTELTLDNFGDVAARHATGDAGLVAFGEALIGNFDWCLKFTPDDIYRCDASKPVWNLLAFERDGATALMMKDFDLAGVVVGRHPWFDTVWNRAFVPSKSPIEIEVLSQVQRTRSLFPRDALDGLRRHFVERQNAVLSAIQSAEVDAEGRRLALGYANAFFAAIGDDQAFYRPVVGRPDVQVYMDPQRTREACGPKDAIRPGTPVNETQHSGAMSQVVILDVMWRWASKNECNNVQNGPVWIASDAITSDYPPRKSP
jgi:hypothetical protein